MSLQYARPEARDECEAFAVCDLKRENNECGYNDEREIGDDVQHGDVCADSALDEYELRK